ncbi:hypothetical protein Glo7428_2900 [Gloeocapsa sp. PCC 7428]|nr:hypothetical protein [Gloeocapsa sp. PCC 7428]AFZ31395.1 hypothetical protein Glo7428_2900 [Gloeocapsa sp. PCC 7428]
MTEHQRLSSKITPIVQAAAQAIERHRRLGQAIAIWHASKDIINAIANS